jgi:hypothetical protein
MNKVLKSFLIGALSIFVFIVCLGLAYFFLFDYPYPTSKTVNAWEQNFKHDVTSDIKNFRGFWLDADTAVYIYGYEFVAPSVEDHKKQIVSSLNDFRVHTDNDQLLVLRQPATYSHPEGYNEWRFIFTPGSRYVTVLFANLDSEVEMAQHEELVARTEKFHREAQ